MVLQAVEVFVNGLSFGDPNMVALNDWLQKMEAERRADYALFRRYYGGDHPTELTDRLKKFLNSGLNSGDLKFRDNFMEVVVDALAERLMVTSFGTNEDGDSKPVAEWAWNTWQANRMDETHSIVHTESVMVGDSYVLVDWDPQEGRVFITHQLPETIIPHYNEATRRIDMASKKWVERPIGEDMLTRLNLYYPDRIEKYAVGPKDTVWQKHRDPGEEGWPQPWLDKAGQPMGVNIFHFRNKPAGSDFGQSELRNAIHIQDLLNKTLIDLAMINDNAGFGRAYVVDMNLDRTAVDMIPGAFWSMKSDDEGGTSKVGTIPADSPEGALKTMDALVQHIAGTTRTPQYLFQLMGGAPSGEALKTAESGLIAKAKDRQVRFGNGWEDVMAFALKVQETFGQSVGELTERFEVGWDDPNTRNEVAFLESLEKKAALGVSQEQLWREMGYDQEQIDRMLEDQTATKVRDANVGAEILRGFTAGNIEGGTP